MSAATRDTHKNSLNTEHTSTGWGEMETSHESEGGPESEQPHDSLSPSSTPQERTCRYCLEPERNPPDPDNPLISPCLCSGTQKYVHFECLKSWQVMILTNSLHNTKENRHSICSTCGGEYQGVPSPSRLSLVELKCYPNYVRSLTCGCFLVTSLIRSQRSLPNNTNIPPILAALFELKSSHWRYGVYWIYHYEKNEDGTGNEPILAINLTRQQNGTRDEPIPDEVLNEIELCRTADREMIRICHHNGGPVHWSSVRTGTCVLPLSRAQLFTLHSTIFRSNPEEEAATQGQPSPPISTSLYDIMNPTAPPQEQFKIWFISPEKSLIIGKFSHVVQMVRYILHTIPLSDTNQASYLINSYSGYAKWNRAQLIDELSDPNGWGLVIPELTLPVCQEYLATGRYTPSGRAPDQANNQGNNEDSNVENSLPSDPRSLLRRFADGARHQLWNNVRGLVLPRISPIGRSVGSTSER